MSKNHDVAGQRPDDDDDRPRGPQTWKERHGGTLIALIAMALLGLVMVVQTAC